MRIEDFWEDTDVYFIQFETKSSNGDNTRIISKCIILPTNYSINKVTKIIYNSFNSVVKFLNVEYFGDGLYLKNKNIASA